MTPPLRYGNRLLELSTHPTSPSIVSNNIASYKSLSLLCDDKVCEVTLSDSRFSTCEVETEKPFYGGIGYSAGVPINSLGDFRLGLYCTADTPDERSAAQHSGINDLGFNPRTKGSTNVSQIADL